MKDDMNLLLTYFSDFASGGHREFSEVVLSTIPCRRHSFEQTLTTIRRKKLKERSLFFFLEKVEEHKNG